MTKFMSRYPDGAAGVALVLIRFSCALSAFAVLALLRFFPSSPALAAVVALALVAGAGTRMAALALAGLAAANVVMAAGDVRTAMIAHVLNYLALALFGPGAYSIDAKLFGRRVIRLEPRSPDRGSGD